MFDPHGTRNSNRRYYTRKGQVIQAKRVDAPLGIENRMIPIYKDYLIKNHLVSVTPPPTPTSKITISKFKFSDDSQTYKITEAFVLSDGTATFELEGQKQLLSFTHINGKYQVYLDFIPSGTTWTVPSGRWFTGFDTQPRPNSDYWELKQENGTTVITIEDNAALSYTQASHLKMCTLPDTFYEVVLPS